jgi:MerR family transcriptional regulator, light-induced transcriptional regulator
MNAFTIKDLENLSGIKAHTIRIWEQRYNFLKPQRTTTNIRYYTNEELKTVLNIALLNKYGFKISHIDRMQPDEISSRILSLGDPKAIQERVVNELVQHMVDLDIEKFEKILTGYINVKGMERAVMQIIFPFLEKIGILWQTGHIFPGQEHLVTNVIRQKLIVAIEGCMPVTHTDTTFLLFLPEGEHHELGLLFTWYMMKSRGFRVIYLGANVPVRDVIHLLEFKKPDYTFIHLTATCPNFNFEKFLHNAENRFFDTPTVISGLLTHQYKKKVPANVHFKKSLQEVVEMLVSLSSR